MTSVLLMIIRALSLFLLLVLPALVAPVKAQVSLPGVDAPKEPAAGETELQALSNALFSVQAELEQLGTNTADRVTGETLNRIRSLVVEQIALLRETDPARHPSVSALPPIPALSEHQPPYPLDLVDSLRHARRVRDKALENHRTLLEAAGSESDEAGAVLKAREQELRARVEGTEPLADRDQVLARLRLEVRLAEQQAGLRRIALRRLRAAADHMKQQRDAAEEQLAAIGRQISFDSSQLEGKLFAVARREDALRRELDAAQFALRLAESTPADAPVFTERVSAARLAIAALEERLALVPKNREGWQRRHAIYNRSIAPADRLQWRDENQQEVSRLERTLRLRRLQQEEMAASVRESNEDESSDEHTQLAAQTAAAYDSLLGALQRAADLHLNLREDHDLLFGRGLATEEALEKARQVVGAVWNFEIAALDDRSITVKKVVYALVLILIGLKLARLFSHSVVNRVLGRFRVEASTASAMATLLFYVLAVLVFVTALGVANIPLTLFALLGGALAIGVGFGSQNILNNFISGLILLVERPIRTGDMVDVGGTYGRVEHVGLRCTQVRSFDNVDILVPNSSFLESNVVNWTLTDDRTRGALFLGAAYGSPTERVREIMLQAAREHEKVLKKPAPEVMFMDFGDNALTFRLYIWVRMRSPSDRDRVLSDLRFTIDDTFRAEGITIAFPQRDVHLNTLEPLDVRVLPPEPPHPES